MMELYPEIYSCIGCNACTRGCPQGLPVMQYIASAQRGDFEECARLSFDCCLLYTSQQALAAAFRKYRK